MQQRAGKSDQEENSCCAYGKNVARHAPVELFRLVQPPGSLKVEQSGKHSIYKEIDQEFRRTGKLGKHEVDAELRKSENSKDEHLVHFLVEKRKRARDLHS